MPITTAIKAQRDNELLAAFICNLTFNAFIGGRKKIYTGDDFARQPLDAKFEIYLGYPIGLFDRCTQFEANEITPNGTKVD